MEEEFGQRIRARRLNHSMTLADLADASGVSVSMLSQVERGERVPTLTIALRIAEGLHCHLSEILDSPEKTPLGLVRREDSTGVVDPETGIQRLLLSRRIPPSVIEVTWYRIPPGARAGPFIHRDSSLVEEVTVVAGKLRVTIGEEVSELRVGDSVSFKGAVQHHFDNPGRRTCAYVHLAHPSAYGAGPIV